MLKAPFRGWLTYFVLPKGMSPTRTPKSTIALSVPVAVPVAATVAPHKRPSRNHVLLPIFDRLECSALLPLLKPQPPALPVFKKKKKKERRPTYQQGAQHDA